MGYSNRMEWLRLNGLLNGNFYGVCADFNGLFTAFVPTFTDFSRVYRLLQTFTDFSREKSEKVGTNAVKVAI